MARQVDETVRHVVACVAPVAAPDMGAREACEGTKRQGQVEDWPLLLPTSQHSATPPSRSRVGRPRASGSGTNNARLAPEMGTRRLTCATLRCSAVAGRRSLHNGGRVGFVFREFVTRS